MSGKALGTRPNIVLILSDDLGYGDLSCYGATKVETPNIDRIAHEGMRYTDAHSPCSVCTPSRYNLLTGRYAWRTWVGTGCLWANDPLLIEPGRMTIASFLNAQGYSTGCVGKWHLGFGSPEMDGWDDVLGPDYNKPLNPGPLECGFDYFFGVPHIGQLPHFFIRNHTVVGLRSDDPIHITPDGKPEWELDYLHRPRTYNPVLAVSGGESTRYTHEEVSIRLADEAVSWLEQQHNEKPFFLYFAPRNVHAPIKPNGRFKGSVIGAYGDYISELDWSVGRILDTLDQMQLTSDTIVIFTSDNGAVQLGHVPAHIVDYNGHRANGPLRGQKTEIYEGGHRIPFIARWPGVVQPGSESNHLIALTDMLATLSDLFEDPLPDEAGEDSFSFLHTLLGTESTGEVRENIVHDSHQVQYAIRQGPWKLLLCQGGGGLGWRPENTNPAEPVGQLYNMDEDPGETINKYNDKPEIVREMTTLLERLRQDGRSRRPLSVE